VVEGTPKESIPELSSQLSKDMSKGLGGFSGG